MTLWTSSGRLVLGFESPISLAVFVLGVTPWLLLAANIIFRSSGEALRRLSVSMIVTASGLIIALTQTRAVIIPVAIGAAVAFFLRNRLTKNGRFVALVALTTLSAILSVCVFSRAGARILSIGSDSDGSTANRFEVWRACADALAVSPSFGVGWGEAGNFVSQWLLPKSNSHQYATVFSTPIQIAIEFGAFAASFCLFVAILIFRSLAAVALRNGSCIALACFTSLVGIAVGSLTNSFLSINAVSFLGLIDGTIALYILRENLSVPRRLALSSANLALLGVAFIYAMAWIVAQSKYHLSVGRHGEVLIVKRAVPYHASGVVRVLVDADLLGPLYGHELRRWLDASKACGFYVDHPKRVLIKSSVWQVGEIAMVGEAQRHYNSLAENNTDDVKFTFIHPKYPPPDRLSSHASNALLPTYDILGVEQAWREMTSVQVRPSGAQGPNLRGTTIRID